MDFKQMSSMNELINNVVEWAHERNIIEGSTAKDQTLKALSEAGELCDAVLKNNLEEVEDAVGDVLVCLINACAIYDTDLETCLGKAWESIKDRKGVMWNGAFVKETDKNYPRIMKALRK